MTTAEIFLTFDDYRLVHVEGRNAYDSFIVVEVSDGKDALGVPRWGEVYRWADADDRGEKPEVFALLCREVRRRIVRDRQHEKDYVAVLQAWQKVDPKVRDLVYAQLQGDSCPHALAVAERLLELLATP